MSESHGQFGLKIYGTTPEVEPLWNSRYRITLRCVYPSRTRSWWYANRSEIFRAYGDLYDAAMLTDGWEPDDDELYPNMVLIEQALEYLPTGESIIRFVYETITSSFVQIKDDNIDYELNGLRRVSRTSIATAETDYSNVVGTTSLTHTDPGRGSKTLYLATVSIEDTDAFRRVQETWIEPGCVDYEIGAPQDGLKRFTLRYWHSITGGPDAPNVINYRRTENFQGFNVLTISGYKTSDDEELPTDGTNKLINSHQITYDFPLPGVKALKEYGQGTPGGGVYARSVNDYTVRSPKVVKVRAWRADWITTEDELEMDTYAERLALIQDVLPLNTGSSSGPKVWNPTDWARLEGQIVAGLTNVNITDVDNVFRNFRVITSADPDYDNTAQGGSTNNDSISETGSCIFRTFNLAFQNGSWFGTITNLGAGQVTTTLGTATLSGGPDRPEGNNWIFEIDKRQDFEDENGVKFYRLSMIFGYVPDFDNGEDMWTTPSTDWNIS